MPRCRVSAVALFCLIAGGACSKEDEPSTPSVITITITPTTPVLHVGETVNLDVNVKGSPVETLVWNSLDQQIAIVDQHGTVKGISPGQTLITVRLGPNSNTMGAVGVMVQ
jgi:uncharacterized protein YjdB